MNTFPAFEQTLDQALDALSAGSPIVARSGTWTAEIVQRFDAGVVVNDFSPLQILSAVDLVIAGFYRYSSNALAAGAVLQEENSAAILFRVLTD